MFRGRRATMQITEPVTMITDYALAAASVSFAAAMRRRIRPETRLSAWFWCAAFAACAVAAAIGGTYHGFATYLASEAAQKLRTIVAALMGVSLAFIIAGIHSAYIRREDGTVKWLAYGILTTLIGAAVQQSRFPNLANFNHNDAYHVIQIAGLYFLFRCALTVKDRPGVGFSLEQAEKAELDRSSTTAVQPQIRPTRT